MRIIERDAQVPEVVLRTVRISITCQSCPPALANADADPRYEPDVRVKVCTLSLILTPIVIYTRQTILCAHA
jgi:hypothetical protein